jgi:hypothetical protein
MLQAHYDLVTHTCRIATGTAEHGPKTSVRLFETKELREVVKTRGLRATHRSVSVKASLGSAYLLSKLNSPVNPADILMCVSDGHSSDISSAL